jgi:phosphatidylinositol glycan class B
MSLAGAAELDLWSDTAPEGMRAVDWRKFFWRWMGLSLAFHLIAAWFGVGYQSADEHFQILEFCNFLLGRTPVSHLAVEYPERIRPWLQPWLYSWLARGWLALGVDNPFTWALSFRLSSALVGWGSAVALAQLGLRWFETDRARRFVVLASAMMWFFPVLHARPSSESLAGSCFVLGLALVWRARESLRSRPWLWLAAGALFGAAFEFRFQVGILVLGLAVWLKVVGREKWGRLALVTLGFALIFALGRYVDQIAYGEWVLSPWRYVQYNLIRGEVSRYGRSAWWDIFRMATTETWPALGLPLAVAAVVAWIRHPRHVLTWCQVPFFLVHVAIAHKELRFFYPIAATMPVLLTLALYSRHTQSLTSVLERRPWRWLWAFFKLDNAVALLCLSLVPLSRNVQFYEGLWHQIPAGTARFELFTPERDPYEVLGSPIDYYRPPALKVTKFANWPEFARALDHPATRSRSEPTVRHLFVTSFRLPPEATALVPRCEPVFRTLPDWVERVNWGDWLKRVNVWTLFRCSG